MSYPKGNTSLLNIVSNRTWFALQGGRILNLINTDNISLTPLGKRLVHITDQSEIATLTYSRRVKDFFICYYSKKKMSFLLCNIVKKKE